MARIPYADLSNPEIRPVADRIVAERGGILHLYQMLLHSPPVATGWLGYLTAIRHLSGLSGAMRELVIMRIAILNGAPCEAEQHAPIGLKEGMTQAQLDTLDKWKSSDCFDSQARAVLANTDAMTRNVNVSKEIFDAVSASLTPRLLVELTATIAVYNMVSRFLEALQIHSSDPVPTS